MKRIRTHIIGGVVVGLLAGPVVLGVPVVFANTGDGMPGQANLDKVAAPNDYAGLWGDATGGVAGRPYVKTLSVINGPTTTPVITNGTVTTPESSTPGAITAVISPTNLCKTGQTSNNGNQCYSTPNRLGIAIGYVKSAGQIGYNFTAPTGQNGTPLSLAAPVTSDTVIELVVNMNTWGSNLRWTWMNGAPQFWRVDDLGSPNAEFTLRYKMVTGPSQACQSAIPVMACNPADAARNWGNNFNPQKILKSEMVLSLDETGVSQAFNGALFASSNADIGSLVEARTEAGAPAINYGIIGPSSLGGAPNLATFQAFVSDVSLLNYFGVTSDVVSTESFRDSALGISRSDGGTGGTPTWTRWDAGAFGTNGWFLSIPDISFNGNAVSSQGVSASAQTTTQPARVSVRQKVSARVSARRTSSKASVTLRATASVCAKSSCRVVISKIGGTLSAKSTKVRTVAVTRRSRSVSVSTTAKVSARQSLTVMLQAKKAGKWVYVSSGVAKP